MEFAETIWRDFETQGVPSSGLHKPRKSEIREWGTYLESLATMLTAAGGKIYPTKSAMEADLSPTANTPAVVLQDPAAANNGLYRRVGATGTGSWALVLNFVPGYQFIKVTDAGAGTPNAIVAMSIIPVPSASNAALMFMNVFEPNTGAVTLAINGEPPKSLVTNTGAQLASGYLAAGMTIAFVFDGSNYRLLTDVVSSSIVAAAEAARDGAEQARIGAEEARDEAIAAVENIPLPKATVAAMQADTPAEDPDYYSVVFYDINQYPGSGAVWKKVASNPGHGGARQNGNGTWYEIDEQAINILMLGAKPTGNVADAAVNAASLAAALAVSGHAVIPDVDGGFHFGTNTITVGTNQTVRGEGGQARVFSTASDCLFKLTGYGVLSTIENLWIDMEGAGPLSSAIRYATHQNVVWRTDLRNILFSRCYCAIDQNNKVGIFTVTIAAPAVFTCANHGLVAGDPVRLQSSGTLPAGLDATAQYYVLATGLTANTFRISTTPGGAPVNTSGSQSGTHKFTTGFFLAETVWEDLKCIFPKGTQVYSKYSQGFFQVNRFLVDCTAQGVGPGTPFDGWTQPTLLVEMARFERYAGLELNRFDVVGQGFMVPTYEAGAVGIVIDGAASPSNAYLWLDRVRTEAMRGHGILISDTNFIYSDKVEAYGSRGFGIYVERCNIIQGVNWFCRGGRDLASPGPNAAGIAFISCNEVQIGTLMVDQTTGSGLLVTNSNNCVFTNVRINGTDRYGIEEAGTSDSNMYDHVVFRNFVLGTHFLVGQHSAIDWYTASGGQQWSGAWTPGLSFGGGATGMIYTAQAGRWVMDRRTKKIKLWGTFTLSAKGSSAGAAAITGLPSNARVVSNMFYGGVVSYATNLVTISHIQGCAIGPGGNTLSLYTPSGALVTDANFGANSQVIFAIEYETA